MLKTRNSSAAVDVLIYGCRRGRNAQRDVVHAVWGRVRHVQRCLERINEVFLDPQMKDSAVQLWM